MRILTRDDATELAIIIQRKHTGLVFHNSVLFERKITISTFSVGENFGVKLNVNINSDIDDSPIAFNFVIGDGMTKTKLDIIHDFDKQIKSEMIKHICDNANKFPQF